MRCRSQFLAPDRSRDTGITVLFTTVWLGAMSVVGSGERTAWANGEARRDPVSDSFVDRDMWEGRQLLVHDRKQVCLNGIDAHLLGAH